MKPENSKKVKFKSVQNTDVEGEKEIIKSPQVKETDIEKIINEIYKWISKLEDNKKKVICYTENMPKELDRMEVTEESIKFFAKIRFENVQYEAHREIAKLIMLGYARVIDWETEYRVSKGFFKAGMNRFDIIGNNRKPNIECSAEKIISKAVKVSIPSNLSE
jgi:hypothetical protein